jgi:hypothetical protein
MEFGDIIDVLDSSFLHLELLILLNDRIRGSIPLLDHHDELLIEFEDLISCYHQLTDDTCDLHV